MSWEEPYMRHPLTRLPATWREQIATASLFLLFLGAATLRETQAAPVPDFTLQLFDGNSISLKDYRGKPVLVNFFHSK